MIIDDSMMFNSNEGIQALDVAPVIVNNSTFVPLRAVSQSLNASVDWNGYTHTAFINSPNQHKNLNNEVTMYAPDGRTMLINKSELNDYLNVGWYAKYDEAQSAINHQTKAIKANLIMQDS